jgi:hypothetical protein
VADVTATYGLNCGTFAYTATVDKLIPSSPDAFKSLSIDQTNLTVNIVLDASKIGADGLTAELSLTGKLVSYPPFQTEPFTVKVYTFECSAQSSTYLYQVKNEAMSIVFAVKQAPDI